MMPSRWYQFCFISISGGSESIFGSQVLRGRRKRLHARETIDDKNFDIFVHGLMVGCHFQSCLWQPMDSFQLALIMAAINATQFDDE